jgi:hypothetical protein
MSGNGDAPAIPVMDETPEHGQHYGLSKREHFAGLAMQGLLGNQRVVEFGDMDSVGNVCRAAVKQADALLAELDKVNEN